MLTTVATIPQPLPTALPITPASSTSQLEATTLAAPADPAANPCCSSQLHPAFADVLARDHELRGFKCLEDAQRRESE